MSSEKGSKSNEAPNPSPDNESLVKRLAGPSVTKAGLAKDQTEINRIIAEVSKGSKFYENEKRKDRELTERIDRILKLKDDLVKETNLSMVQAEADRLIEDLESQRDLSQCIVHVDMDAFYASVELLLNPSLHGKPFGVGKGVLSTASYEARKYGVRSGMAGFVAKKLCPDLIFVPLNFQKYSEMSAKVMAIFKQYDPNMIVAGCDEGYLKSIDELSSITVYCAEHSLSPEECVSEMRSRVHSETKLTVSAGIAPNKMLAKVRGGPYLSHSKDLSFNRAQICSDKNKPNGQFHLPFERESIKAFMQELPIRKIPGVGRVNERLLDSIGVKTCGDIYTHRAVISLMDHYFGKVFLFRTYLGITSNVVEAYRRDETKSIGSERTFKALSDEAEILSKLEEIAVELENEMSENGWAGKTITLKYKLDTFQVFTMARSFDRWITKKEDLFNTGKVLIKSRFPLCLRLIGLRVTKLKDLRSSNEQGIKKFFQSGDNKGSPKKRKAIIDSENEHVEEDAMPGFYEHEHNRIDWNDCDDPDIAESAGGPVLSDEKDQASRTKAAGPSKLDQSARAPNDVVICPICSKELETDNTGLNAHIDFCLSKGVIMQATAGTKSSSGSRLKPKHDSKRQRQL